MSERIKCRGSIQRSGRVPRAAEHVVILAVYRAGPYQGSQLSTSDLLVVKTDSLELPCGWRISGGVCSRLKIEDCRV
eukprot:622378-Amphidinium_carterae.1